MARPAQWTLVFRNDTRLQEEARTQIVLPARGVVSRLTLWIDGEPREAAFGKRAQVRGAYESVVRQQRDPVLVASDRVADLGNGVHPATATRIEMLQRAIRNTPFRGGADNVPALTRAWDLAHESPDAVILWLHAPQAELLTHVGALPQRWDRSPGMPRLLSVQLAPGTDRVLEALDGVREITQPLPPTTALRKFTSLVSSITSSKRIDVVGGKSDKTPSEQDAIETTAHLARLWAHEQSMKLNRSSRPDGVNEAAAVATSYQLVTPVIGAVVLETALDRRASRRLYTRRHCSPRPAGFCGNPVRCRASNPTPGNERVRSFRVE